MADHSIEIAALEAILNGGASSVSVDGLSTSFNLAEVRKRLAELRSADDDTIAAGRVRPTNSVIRLNFS